MDANTETTVEEVVVPAVDAPAPTEDPIESPQPVEEPVAEGVATEAVPQGVVRTQGNNGFASETPVRFQ